MPRLRTIRNSTVCLTIPARGTRAGFRGWTALASLMFVEEPSGAAPASSPRGALPKSPAYRPGGRERNVRLPPAATELLVAVVEDRQERFLRDLDVADLLHPLLAFLLL